MGNTKLLEDILERVKDKERNDYSLDISQTSTALLKRELDTLGIKYEPTVVRGIRRTKIFDGDLEIRKHRRSYYHNNSMYGMAITTDKFITEKFLKLSNIPTSNSILLREGDIDQALKHIVDGRNRYVVKPLDLMQGRGVHTDVTPENLDEVWKRCFALQKRLKVKTPRVLVQDYIEGFEVRVVVAEGKAMSATIRTPAYVIGNGQDTIEHLINQKNEVRSKNGFFANKLIKVNRRMTNHLKRQNLNMKSVIEDGKLIVLNPVSNLVNGGENIVITDLIKKEILELAEAGVTAIPGCQTAGVDIILNDLNDTEAVILEINSRPAFQLNYFPYIGEPQNPFNYIFRSLILEKRVLEDRLDIDQMSREDIQLMAERYKALHKKQKALENVIKNLTNK
ncbi:ATP-grasp domain-containing protein [Aliicoccus persicus]|uniref:Glutamate--cysteine ligase/cyanophycin synthetase n=1 Tax=Aliicoccus persicus TaxID=930138 RepID=A0A662YZZ4_9STAP|nr:ATP-grasp domain-containing protein [Aliicoccus persicus]SEV79842.1 glutamate--cysteine ligase/cyanophycin synthetase [Aliicoccus persicus]